MHGSPQATRDLDDLALTRRCADGDAAAQRELFERTRQQVHRTLYRVLGSNRYMEDLVQEAYVEAFRSIGTFRGDSTLRTWIDTIAARVVYRHLARRQLAPTGDDDLLAAPGCDGALERHTDARIALRQLYAILDRVDAKYRIAFTLHVIDGRPLKEVASIAGCSLMAIKNRIWRARRMIDKQAAREPALRDFVADLRPAT